MNKFKSDAKSLVDRLFDTKFFHDKITRDDMIAVESLIEHLLESRFNSYVRVNELVAQSKERREIK